MEYSGTQSYLEITIDSDHDIERRIGKNIKPKKHLLKIWKVGRRSSILSL